MRHLSQRDLAFAVALASLAGYVDALGFLSTGGFFVSFMSGNSTRLAVGAGRGVWMVAGLAGGLILAFVAGVVAGSLAARTKPGLSAVAVLGVVTLFLLGALGLRSSGLAAWTPACLALAMGAENAVFQRDGAAGFGVTYMTGALVKVGQGLARIAMGEAGGDWLRFLALWSGLAGGAVLGAMLWRDVSVAAFMLAPFLAAALGVWAYSTDRATI